MSFNWDALLLGAASFLIIGLFHPLVIKGEYAGGGRVSLVFCRGAAGSGGLFLLLEYQGAF